LSRDSVAGLCSTKLSMKKKNKVLKFIGKKLKRANKNGKLTFYSIMATLIISISIHASSPDLFWEIIGFGIGILIALALIVFIGCFLDSFIYLLVLAVYIIVAFLLSCVIGWYGVLFVLALLFINYTMRKNAQVTEELFKRLDKITK